jgi:hypothetical protein
LLYKNWAVLYTQRLEVQSIGTLLSNLSASILGIMGIFGFFMSYFEEAFISYMSKRRKKLDFRAFIKNREGIIDKNFISYIEEISQIACNKNHITEGDSSSINRTKVHDESVIMSHLALEVYDLDI